MQEAFREKQIANPYKARRTAKARLPFKLVVQMGTLVRSPATHYPVVGDRTHVGINQVHEKQGHLFAIHLCDDSTQLGGV
jgi:hypothetical protein